MSKVKQKPKSNLPELPPTVMDITSLQKKSMLEYFMSIIYERAIADVRDGMKPIHRYCIWDLYDEGIYPNKSFVKSAKVVGNIIGCWSPHGDAATYDTLVRMAQDFSMNVPYVIPKGNFGSIDGSAAAAYRYSELKMSRFALEQCQGLKDNAVEFTSNYDNTRKEPTVLPSKSLNLLINGSFGISGGFQQSILPCNLNDVSNMIIKLIDNPDLSVKDVAKGVIPDFPTGGILCSRKAVIDGYVKGSGSVKNRCTTEIVVNKTGTSEIRITELPYMVTIGPRQSSMGSSSSGLINSIKEKVKDETIKGISDIHDLSTESVDIRIYIKKGYDPNVILNNLFKYTNMEVTQKISLVCKNGNHFKVYNIKEIFEEFIQFRIETIKRIIVSKLNKANHRKHILDGLIIALANIDEIITLIKKAKSAKEIVEQLCKKYNLTTEQATAISEMKLRNLSSLEANSIKDEIKEKIDEINQYKKDLSLESVKERIKNEQRELMKEYGWKRRTKVSEINTVSIEDTISDEKAVVVLTQDNYIKRVDNSNIKTQKRNTMGINIGDSDITEMFSTSTKSHLLCFTNKGRVYDLKVYNIKEYSLKAKGSRIESYIQLQSDEVVKNILCITEEQFQDKNSYLVFLTKNGLLKKTSLELFSNIRKTGIFAIDIREYDELISVKYIDSSKKMQDLFIITKNGLAVRYDHNTLQPLGRKVYGRQSMTLGKDDYIADMDIISDNNELVFIATENGLGKTIKVTDKVKKIRKKNKESDDKIEVVNDDGFPRLKEISSSKKGRLAIKLNKDDSVVSSKLISDENSKLVVITNNKIMTTKASEFNKPIKRNTKGMKLINLNTDDKVIKVVID